MTEQEEFFSPNYNRLLNIATWAKYLAWVVLIIYILWAALIVSQDFSNHGSQLQPNVRLLEQFKVVLNLATTLLRGAIYYLVLKGISLGLNMIVETDINYREQEKTGVRNEQ